MDKFLILFFSLFLFVLSGCDNREGFEDFNAGPKILYSVNGEAYLLKHNFGHTYLIARIKDADRNVFTESELY